MTNIKHSTLLSMRILCLVKNNHRVQCTYLKVNLLVNWPKNLDSKTKIKRLIFLNLNRFYKKNRKCKLTYLIPKCNSYGECESHVSVLLNWFKVEHSFIVKRFTNEQEVINIIFHLVICSNFAFVVTIYFRGKCYFVLGMQAYPQWT